MKLKFKSMNCGYCCLYWPHASKYHSAPYVGRLSFVSSRNVLLRYSVPKDDFVQFGHEGSRVPVDCSKTTRHSIHFW